MARPTLIAILSLLLATGCAQIQSIFAPTPPPLPRPPRPAQPERREPPPLLSPQVSPEQEGRLMDEANAKIQGAERTLQSIDTGKLANDQQETYQTIHSFLSQAREALARKDFPQALNLAQKAQILSSELSKALR
ncbi:MAG: exported protein of unknown function [candidate division NC10 bacterium]|nr:exported protein of unknown function [candidate division NC10 bacterium]